MDIVKKISLLCILFLVVGIGCLALVNKDKDINSLEKQIVVLVEERNTFEDKYNNAVVDLREKQNLIVTLTQERDNYLSSRNEYYNQCQILTEQITILENDKKTLEEELASSQEEIDYLKKFNNSLFTSLSSKSTEIINLNTQITELQNSISEKDSDLTAKQEQISSLENEKAILIAEKETLQNTIASNNEIIESLNSQRIELYNEMAEKDKTIVTLRSNISDKNTQIENLNTQIENLNTQITDLQDSENRQIAYIQNLQNTIVDLNDKIFELEQKIDYTITYIVGEDVTVKTAKGHTTITLLEKPTKTDLTFDGWYYDGNKIETTTFDITNTDASLTGYFKCLITCGNDTALVDVGSSLGDNAIIPFGIDGDVYAYYLNGDKTKSYGYDEICAYKFTKNTSISYELVGNVPNIDYSYGGRFSDWSKTDIPSPYSSVQSIQFTIDKSSNSGQCFFETSNGSYQSTFDIVFDEDLKVYNFVTTVNNQFEFAGVFALKRGLTGDDISTLINEQNYAWHFGFRPNLLNCVGENFEFNPSLSRLNISFYIFSANLDGTYDTNMA